MFEEPKLHIIQFPGLGDAERDERERRRGEGERRWSEHLAGVIGDLAATGDLASQVDALLARLFIHERDDGERCLCACHPQIPASDLHDYGFACPCRLTAEERRTQAAEWLNEIHTYWDSPEGRAESVARQIEDDDLLTWLVAHEDVVVTGHGGFAPEQWWGSVEGHSFYFRERHDEWRIELDLRPTGRFSRVWRQGNIDGDASFDSMEIEQGDVIAEGTIGAVGYGQRPVERATFITGIIKDHLDRQRCQVHTTERNHLERLFGRPLRWCPACGTRL